ncbi:condensation protein [Rhodococcus triatomae]|uniref:Condensation domain-containing protein n=1 Tax=Rhodococcus triatomae TaxID=300028 RepID=A0A1G8FEN1_9NOCA|nr:condensation domain-containing protein [Rhodococcus triatomae]QNG19464.1 condensation protein [Rhodococcus triatomae]QNG24622.1 condensation protein [Rhodococcus triatomae]SDH80565.1 Condensation domain-containing protein [Rhodococcus triatomae]
MHVTSIDRYLVEPGVVTEWSVTSNSVADSPLPPSYNQRFHLDTARTHGVGRSVWMAAAFDLPGTLDRPALERALRYFIRRHDTLQTGFHADSAGIRRVGLDPEHVELRSSTPLAVDTAAGLRDHLRQRFTEVCDPLTFPAYTFATIERDSHYTVVSAFDHTLVDGYSLVIALGELRRIYESCQAGVEPDPALHVELGDPGSFLRYCRQEAEAPVTDVADPRVREWARFYSRCGGTAPSFPLDLGVEAGVPAPQGADVRPLLDAAGTERFEQICLDSGGSLFTGVLTAMGSAIHEISGSRRMPLQFPLHTRRNPQWANALGWLTTSAPLTVEISTDGDFQASLANTHASFRTALTLGGVSMAQVGKALGDGYRRTRTDVFMVSYIDYRRLPGTDDHEMLNAHHVSNVTVADDAQFWISRTNRGLALRSRFPDTPVARATVESFLTTLRRFLESICERGVTPVADPTRALRLDEAPVV